MADRVLLETRFLRCIDRDGWFFVERPNATGVVAIFAVTDQRRLLLVEQYRAPIARTVIELPAGLVGDDPAHGKEDLAAGANRELCEETGYQARRMEQLAVLPTSPGVTNEIVTLFRATGLQKVGAGGGVDGEDLRVHEVPLDDLGPWLAERERGGDMISAQLYAGLYVARVTDTGR